MLSKIPHYAHRIKELGCKNLILSLSYKINKKLFRARYYTKAINKNANHGWQDVSGQLRLTQSFDLFLAQLKENTFLDKIFENFEIQSLESRTYKTMPSPWQAKSNIFYQDIKIQCPTKMQFNEYNPDIKEPWELARFQNIFPLGVKYKDSKNPEHAQIFQDQINDWLDQNPYLLGVNWLCTMEVAIRAINLIWGFYFFKNSKDISQNFWQKFVCTLYNHMHFINNNWEWSDKPNNHYLADLLGYFYLCVFFGESNKFQWCIKKLLEQFSHQILPDGTAYEGSTNYHKLDTEIFIHFKLLCKAINEPLPDEFHARLSKMLEFIAGCQDTSGNLVQIGDNDSGKIVGFLKPFALSLSKGLTERFVIKTYPNFGLTIIKNKDIHITFRHGTFKKNQPTGHLHQDALAITLSINNTQVLVDPGTYCYTANSAWRNLMRSVEMHNTFYPEQSLEFPELFQLDLPHKKEVDPAQITTKNNNFIIKDSIQTASRILDFDMATNELKIIDRTQNHTSIAWNWQWIFAPEIDIEKINDNLWEIKREKRLLMRLKSTLEFKLVDSFYSAEYGKIEKTKKMIAQKMHFASEQATFTLHI